MQNLKVVTQFQGEQRSIFLDSESGRGTYIMKNENQYFPKDGTEAYVSVIAGFTWPFQHLLASLLPQR